MEKEIVEEIMKNCKDWRERLLIRMFPKMFVKAYHVGRKDGVNYILKVMQ